MTNQYGARTAPAGRADMAVDAGLRSFMLGVYSKMGLGLLWSAGVAYAVGAIPEVSAIALTSPGIHIIQWGPIALLLGSMFLMRNPSPTGANILYWSVVTLIGAGLGLWVYLAMSGATATGYGGVTYNVTFEGIGKAFLVTAIAFGGLSLWGYTTKQDLSPIRGFLIFAMFGLLGVALLNMFFFQSDMLQIVMQAVSVLVFGLLIAFQTQELKHSYYAFQGDGRSLAVMTTMGALNLYIAFINIFQVLLSMFSRE